MTIQNAYTNHFFMRNYKPESLRISMMDDTDNWIRTNRLPLFPSKTYCGGEAFPIGTGVLVSNFFYYKNTSNDSLMLNFQIEEEVDESNNFVPISEKQTILLKPGEKKKIFLEWNCIYSTSHQYHGTYGPLFMRIDGWDKTTEQGIKYKTVSETYYIWGGCILKNSVSPSLFISYQKNDSEIQRHTIENQTSPSEKILKFHANIMGTELPPETDTSGVFLSNIRNFNKVSLHDGDNIRTTKTLLYDDDTESYDFPDMKHLISISAPLEKIVYPINAKIGIQPVEERVGESDIKKWELFSEDMRLPTLSDFEKNIVIEKTVTPNREKSGNEKGLIMGTRKIFAPPFNVQILWSTETPPNYSMEMKQIHSKAWVPFGLYRMEFDNNLFKNLQIILKNTTVWSIKNDEKKAGVRGYVLKWGNMEAESFEDVYTHWEEITDFQTYQVSKPEKPKYYEGSIRNVSEYLQKEGDIYAGYLLLIPKYHSVGANESFFNVPEIVLMPKETGRTDEGLPVSELRRGVDYFVSGTTVKFNKEKKLFDINGDNIDEEVFLKRPTEKFFRYKERYVIPDFADEYWVPNTPKSGVSMSLNNEKILKEDSWAWLRVTKDTSYLDSDGNYLTVTGAYTIIRAKVDGIKDREIEYLEPEKYEFDDPNDVYDGYYMKIRSFPSEPKAVSFDFHLDKQKKGIRVPLYHQIELSYWSHTGMGELMGTYDVFLLRDGKKDSKIGTRKAKESFKYTVKKTDKYGGSGVDKDKIVIQMKCDFYAIKGTQLHEWSNISTLKIEIEEGKKGFGVFGKVVDVEYEMRVRPHFIIKYVRDSKSKKLIEKQLEEKIEIDSVDKASLTYEVEHDYS